MSEVTSTAVAIIHLGFAYGYYTASLTNKHCKCKQTLNVNHSGDIHHQQPSAPTSDQMLSLPEVCDLGGIVIIDGVHAPVLQPVRCGHPSSLHLHVVHSGVPSDLQYHLARHNLPSSERCIRRTIQLQCERLNGAQCHLCESGQLNSKYKHTL